MNRKEVEEFLNSREDYGEILNPKIDFLVAAVAPDYEGHLWYEIVGFAEDGENWAIECGKTQANVSEENGWKELHEKLFKERANEAGETLQPETVCVDSGGRYTHDIYIRCSHVKFFKACKFYAKYNAFFVMNKETRIGWNDLTLYMINMMAGEKIISCMLKKRGNYILSHFPEDPERGYDEEYFSTFVYGTENYRLRMLILAGACMQATKAPEEDMRGLW
jgi:hypothetical protein